MTNPHFLIVTRDRYPALRVDVSVLFSKYLSSHFAFDWLIRAEEPGIRGTIAGEKETFRIIEAEGVRYFLSFVRRHTSALWAVLRGRYDLVQCRDCTVISALYALAALLARKPFVYWMSFPIEDDYVDRGLKYLASGKFFRAAPRLLIGHMGRFVLRFIALPLARHVFVQSDRMSVVVAARYNILPDKMTPVPMGVDIAALTQNSVIPAEHPFYENRRVALYLGTINASRQLEVPANGLAQAMQQQQDLVFVAIGAATDEERNNISQIFAAKNLEERLLFINQMPLEDALSHVMRADVCLCPVPPTPMFDLSTPTKLSEYLVMGRHVVANFLPDHNRVINGAGLGVLTDFSAQGFCEAVLRALELGEPTPDEQAHALEWLTANRDYQSLSEMVHQTYRRILDI